MIIWSQELIDNLLFHPTPQSKRYFYSIFSVQDLLIVLTEHCFFFLQRRVRQNCMTLKLSANPI